MPELVIQTLVCTFRCNPPFQEALWHDMHGIIYSPSPPKKKHTHKHCFVYPSSCRFSSHCFFPSPLFCLPIILPFLFPLFFFHHHCFVYPASCHFSSHFFPSPLFCYPSSCRFSSHCFFLPIIVCFLNVG